MRLSNLFFLILTFVIILLGVMGLGVSPAQFLDCPSLLFVLIGPIFISLANFSIGEIIFAVRDVFAKGGSKTGSLVFKNLASYSLTFGVVGTLIGLVAMLAQMEDPAQIRAKMAVCLITTLYGLLLAQCVYIPLAKLIENKVESK